MFVNSRGMTRRQYTHTMGYYTAMENSPAHSMCESQKQHTECNKMHVEEIQKPHTGPGRVIPGGGTGDLGDCDALSLD